MLSSSFFVQCEADVAKRNPLSLSIDGHFYYANWVSLPLSGDVSELRCKCPIWRGVLNPVADIVQHGFAGQDKYITILSCPDCRRAYAVEYEVEYGIDSK